MADVFISYASEDRAWAAQLAAALDARGFSVWWDRKIRTGTEFDTVIERELTQARHVIVVWSPAAAKSAWVRAEARKAIELGTYHPLMCQAVVLPLPFGGYQTPDLSGWSGEPDAFALKQFLAEIAPGQAAEPARVIDPPAQETSPPWYMQRAVVAAFAVGAVVAIAALAFIPTGPRPPVPTPKTASAAPTAREQAPPKPPLPAPAPVEKASPAPEVRATVYFGFDDARLVPEANAILTKLAGDLGGRKAACHLTGKTDTAEAALTPGEATPGAAMATRRAQVVAAALAGLGFDTSQITIEGAGSSQLEVPTADNVHEPLNRAVLITCK